MEWDQIKIEELAQVITKYDLTEVEIQNGDSRIVLKKTPADVHMIQNNHELPMTGIKSRPNIDFQRITEKKVLQDELEVSKAGQKKETEALGFIHKNHEDVQKYVVSPIAGIFYRQSQPGIPPYTEVGQRVKTGDVICLVEAMKMINEIVADRDGVIKEFLVENEQFVEYGTPLAFIEEE